MRRGPARGAPYQYDQNDKQWSGRVLLFSQGQLDAFKAGHPEPFDPGVPAWKTTTMPA